MMSYPSHYKKYPQTSSLLLLFCMFTIFSEAINHQYDGVHLKESSTNSSNLKKSQNSYVKKLPVVNHCCKLSDTSGVYIRSKNHKKSQFALNQDTSRKLDYRYDIRLMKENLSFLLEAKSGDSLQRYKRGLIPKISPKIKKTAGKVLKATGTMLENSSSRNAKAARRSRNRRIRKGRGKARKSEDLRAQGANTSAAATGAQRVVTAQGPLKLETIRKPTQDGLGEKNALDVAGILNSHKNLLGSEKNNVTTQFHSKNEQEKSSETLKEKVTIRSFDFEESAAKEDAVDRSPDAEKSKKVNETPSRDVSRSLGIEVSKKNADGALKEGVVEKSSDIGESTKEVAETTIGQIAARSSSTTDSTKDVEDPSKEEIIVKLLDIEESKKEVGDTVNGDVASSSSLKEERIKEAQRIANIENNKKSSNIGESKAEANDTLNVGLKRTVARKWLAESAQSEEDTALRAREDSEEEEESRFSRT